MVKIPGLDDLKKMGNDLLDSAKTVKLGGVVDKFKSGMEAVGLPKTGSPATSEALGEIYQHIHTTLTELVSSQATQIELIKKLQNQLVTLGKAVETIQTQTTQASTKSDDK